MWKSGIAEQNNFFTCSSLAIIQNPIVKYTKTRIGVVKTSFNCYWSSTTALVVVVELVVVVTFVVVVLLEDSSLCFWWVPAGIVTLPDGTTCIRWFEVFEGVGTCVEDMYSCGDCCNRCVRVGWLGPGLLLPPDDDCWWSQTDCCWLLVDCT